MIVREVKQIVFIIILLESKPVYSAACLIFGKSKSILQLREY